MPTVREQLVREVTALERVIAFSCKGQFAAASFWSQLNLFLGLPTAVLAAISGGSALADHTGVAAALALAVAITAAVAAFLGATERHKLHHAAGNEYSKLGRDMRLWRQFEQPHLADDEVLSKIKDFQGERDRLNEQSPQISRMLFLWAKRRVDREEKVRRERAKARRAAPSLR
jgi:hypothetical protein